MLFHERLQSLLELEGLIGVLDHGQKNTPNPLVRVSLLAVAKVQRIEAGIDRTDSTARWLPLSTKWHFS